MPVDTQPLLQRDSRVQLHTTDCVPTRTLGFRHANVSYRLRYDDTKRTPPHSAQDAATVPPHALQMLGKTPIHRYAVATYVSPHLARDMTDDVAFL